uniref:HhH-GPD domain-containing protein n=1 Tax=Glossina brevipalpis TaxID=37001 RepID=A0A1A9WHT9_9MUSC
MFQNLFRINLRNMASKSKQTVTNKPKTRKNPIKVQQQIELNTNINTNNAIPVAPELEVIEKVSQKGSSTAILDVEDSHSYNYAKTRLRSKEISGELENGGAKLNNKPSVLVLQQDLNEESKKIEKTKKIKITNEVTEATSSKKMKKEINEVVVNWEPKNWQEILDNIRLMRSKDNAPVDTMGCHKCADENADEKTQRFHKLVALMLSSQTKDETTYHAMLRLKEQILTPESIVKMKLNTLENMLHPEPEQTRLALEAWLPQELWGEVNHLLVGFGQTVCIPVKPKCESCLNSNICPSAPKSAQKKINKNENETINPQLAELLNKAEFKKSKTILKNC